MPPLESVQSVGLNHDVCELVEQIKAIEFETTTISAEHIS